MAATRAQWEQSKILYEAAVTNALGEVSTALVSRERLVETERQRERAVAAYREAVRLANRRYVSGLSAYFEVLSRSSSSSPPRSSWPRRAATSSSRWWTSTAPSEEAGRRRGSTRPPRTRSMSRPPFEETTQ